MTSNANNSGYNADMAHPRLKLPKPEVHASHPYKDKANHEKLLEYLRQRMQLGKIARDGQLDRYVAIDKQVSGWMLLNEADKERLKNKNKTGIPQAIKMNLPLAYVHLDDMMTFFAQTFAPNRGMFYQMGAPEEESPAKDMTTIMNNHAVYGSYFREVLLGIFSLLKYNVGGFQLDWTKEYGPKIARQPNGDDKVDSSLAWQGNKLEAVDVYNFLFDPSVHPTKLHTEGEFAGIVRMRSFFWLQKEAAKGNFYNCDTLLVDRQMAQVCEYYRNPPVEAKMSQDGSGGTNWKSILTESRYGTTSAGYELTTMYVHIDPTMFGLVAGTSAEKGARSRYEIWRFTVANDQYVIDCQYQDNVHGQLPYYMGVLNDDLMGPAQKSTGEILSPLQDFASFLLNVHVTMNRKNIWGTTYYDSSRVDMSQIPEGEVAARVPIKPEGYGQDIRTMVHTDNKTLDTKQTMQDLDGVMGIIGQFFPTQALPSQIASIDRAVTNQVAAVQQGANRRQQKAAKLLDDTIFKNIRFAMYYNIVQYQPDDSEVEDLYTGKTIKVDLTQLRGTNLPFIIGQGLKAIDRNQAAELMQQLIFAMIQAPAAAQGVDILGLINYWVSMMDVDIDMNKFKLAPPAAPTGVPGDPAAAGGDAAAIAPATAPASLTSPIYGA